MSDPSQLQLPFTPSDIPDTPQTPSEAPGGKKPKSTVSQVCVACKERHAKCSGDIPCMQCVRRNKARDCRYSAVKKRGPKPKKDLYEYCNKLMVELEVQKQIAQYWKDQFLRSGLPPPEMDATSVHIPSVPNTPSAFPPPATPGGSGPLFKAEQHVSPTGTDDVSMAEDHTDDSGFSISDTTSSSHDSDIQSPFQHQIPKPTPAQTAMLQQLRDIASGPSTYQSGIPELPPRTPTDVAGLMTAAVASKYLSAFFEMMLPILPEFFIQVNPQSAADAWNFTRDEVETANLSLDRLADLFQNAICAGFGCRCAGAPAPMKYFIKKAEELMHLLFFTREAQTVPHLAQTLVLSLVILCFYYVGDEREGSKQSVIMLAYQIVSRHRKEIRPVSMHRVYLVMMGLAENQQDRIYWMQEANQLAQQFHITTPIAASLYNVLYVLSSLHPKFLVTSNRVSSFDRNVLLEFVGRLDSVDTMLATLEAPSSEAMLDMLCVYRLIVVSTRAELALLLNDTTEATRLVEVALQLAPIPSGTRMRSHVFHWGLALTVQSAIELRFPTAKLQSLLKFFDAIQEVVPAAIKVRQMALAYIEQTGDHPQSAPTSDENLQTQQKKRQRIAQVQQLLKQHELLSNNTRSGAVAAAKTPGATIGSLVKDQLQSQVNEIFSKLAKVQSDLSTVADPDITSLQTQIVYQPGQSFLGGTFTSPHGPATPNPNHMVSNAAYPSYGVYYQQPQTPQGLQMAPQDLQSQLNLTSSTENVGNLDEFLQLT